MSARGEGAMPVIEAAYRLEVDDQAWLDEVARLACGTLGDPGLPAAGAVIRSHDAGFVRELDSFLPYDAEFARAVDELEGMIPVRHRAVMYRRTICETASDLARERHLPGAIAKLMIGSKLGRWGTRENLQVNGAILDDLAVGVTASLRDPYTVPPRLQHTWTRVAVHLSAAYRMRRALREGPKVLERAGLVLDRGHVVHASAELAGDKDLRETLRECARAVDHARGALSRDAPDQAVELWTGLFAGRFSVLETFDSDGRAYVVACENEPEVIETRVLTRRERQVVELAAQGHGDDFVGYTLGISPATVQTHLQRALAKMGIDSRARLVRTRATLRSRLTDG